MKELNIMEATVLTSPNPLTLICSKKEDGSTNLAPICFVSYLSFNPPMVGFATGKQSHTGKRVRETGKVIVTVPGESLAGAVMACGASTGAKTDKVAEPASLENLLERLNKEEFDLVAVGRALLVDPDWALKVREGREQDILPFSREALMKLV